MRRAPTAILMYHRVGEDVPDPWRLQVSPANFADHLRMLPKMAEVVPLTEASAPADRPRVVITFDDGYADNLRVAAPMLDEAQLPATVFVVSDMIGNRDGFWWDRLARRLLTGVATKRHARFTLDAAPVLLDIGSSHARQRANQFLQARLQARPPAEVDQCLLALGDAFTAADAVPEHALPMAQRELEDLARYELIDIGAHTATHRNLRSLDEDEQRAELLGSRNALADLVGRAPRSVAFPYGAYDAISVEIARDAFEVAVTTEPGDASGADPARLPRFAVEDWSAEVLERRLQGWLDSGHEEGPVRARRSR